MPPVYYRFRFAFVTDTDTGHVVLSSGESVNLYYRVAGVETKVLRTLVLKIKISYSVM